ncbi:hypothetical protein [Chryseobacterium scophthalmum]|uniref:Uncharacterized protein n=1 Tax=Chryseobacterium scophthalmum TaxID=59733 RepID=A0A1N6G0I1_9FLAO|nr:hypothetical protein [Chryseobacterium scophthalmum]SIO01065.1 hypothetical protein SAMN05421769_1764 [Chryseobacterium scophthalmum]
MLNCFFNDIEKFDLENKKHLLSAVVDGIIQVLKIKKYCCALVLFHNTKTEHYYNTKPTAKLQWVLFICHTI